MTTKADILQKYALFGSKLRGTEQVENALNQLLQEMQTPENIRKLGDAVGLEWDTNNENVISLRKTFEKIEKVKPTRQQKENSRSRKQPKIKVKASATPESNIVDEA